MIRVCFISLGAAKLFDPDSPGSHGGAELQMYMWARQIAKKTGFKTTFVIGGDIGAETKVYGQIKTYKAAMPNEQDGIFKRAVRAIGFMRLLNRVDADIYVTTARSAHNGLTTFFCKLRNRKHVHRVASDRELPQRPVGATEKIHLWGVRNADLLIAQNDFQQKLIQNRFNRQSIKIMNFCPPGGFESNENRKFILWVGRCIPLKNPEAFLRLADDFPAESFVMIGPPGKNLDYFRKIGKLVKGFKNVDYIPSVPLQEIGYYFARAKIFVNTSDYEGFPNTFLQAGSAGVPIVSLRVDPDRFLSEQHCGYVCEGDYNKMKTSVATLLNDKSDWLKKSRKITDYVNRYHDPQKNVDLLKDAFTSLLRERE